MREFSQAGSGLLIGLGYLDPLLLLELLARLVIERFLAAPGKSLNHLDKVICPPRIIDSPLR
jgi:hypothetical protein